MKGKEQDKEESREMCAAETKERGETEGVLMERKESNPTENNRYGLTDTRVRWRRSSKRWWEDIGDKVVLREEGREKKLTQPIR